MSKVGLIAFQVAQWPLEMAREACGGRCLSVAERTERTAINSVGSRVISYCDLINSLTLGQGVISSEWESRVPCVVSLLQLCPRLPFCASCVSVSELGSLRDPPYSPPMLGG